VRNFLKYIFLIFSIIFGYNYAFAHAVLEFSEPARRALLYRAPEQVVLTFNEPVEIQFSKILLMDSEDKIIVSSSKLKNIYDNNSIGMQIPKLTSGIYFIQFQVLSIDGHKVKGRYKFTIKDSN